MLHLKVHYANLTLHKIEKNELQKTLISQVTNGYYWYYFSYIIVNKELSQS